MNKLFCLGLLSAALISGEVLFNSCAKKYSITQVTGVSIDKDTLSISVGDTKNLTATVEPPDAPNQRVSWSSDNNFVATVNGLGSVMAISAGTATITATTSEGNYTNVCFVKVTDSGKKPGEGGGDGDEDEDEDGDGDGAEGETKDTVNQPPPMDSAEYAEYVNAMIDMVHVQGGRFIMGEGEAWSHDVTLGSFNIGKYEVTQKLWQAVMGSLPPILTWYNLQEGDTIRIGDNYPVYYISWYDTQEFLKKLNKLTGKNFRLPTEAEWEYAAGGGKENNRFVYSGSNDCGSVAWYEDNSGGVVHEVGGKMANELYIHDMSGNVSEWVSDWYDDLSGDAESNPTGPDSRPDLTDKVVRGGSRDWWDNNCKITSRDMWPATAASYKFFYEVGFRLVHP